MKHLLEQIIAEIKASARFKWIALGAAWVIFLLAAPGVFIMPSIYESRAQIYVDTTSILRPLLAGIAVSPNTGDQADAVRKALLARPTLEKVVRSTGLNARARTPEQLDSLIKSLEKDLVVTGDSRTNTYFISYQDRNPQLTQAVVQVLLDTFVRDALGANRSDTGNARKFLGQQVAEYEGRLAASEQRLANFKKENVGLMPDQRGDYFTRLQAELAQSDKIRTDLAVAASERDELRRKITATGAAGSSPARLPSDKEIQAATSIDARIQEAHRQLDELLLRFTDKHPDVLALRDTIARLEERRQAELGNVRQTNSSVRSDGSITVDSVLQDLQIRLNSADVRVATLQAEVERSNSRVGELRRLVTTTPQIEAEMAQLNRDYGVTKTQYEQLLQRLESARISDQADKSDELKFRIMESPRVPLQPIAPPRFVLLLMVLAASLVVGAGLAYGLNLARPVFMTAHSLRKATGLDVLGAVSRATRDRDRMATRARRMGYALAASTLLGLFTISIIFAQQASHAMRLAFHLE